MTAATAFSPSPAPQAFQLATVLLANPGNRRLRAAFAHSLSGGLPVRFNPDIKTALLICFSAIYDVDLRFSFQPWIATLMTDPGHPKLHELSAIIHDPVALDRWYDSLTPANATFAQDPFFIEGLRVLAIVGPSFEKFLTGWRRWLCLNHEKILADGRINHFLPALCALAEQCHYNEYIFDVTATENETVAALKSTLSSSSHAGLWALQGCYEPLYPFKNRLRQDTTPAFVKMLKTHIADHEHEDKIKESIESFGAIADTVSQNVRSQYEENPYPRWISASMIPSPADDMITPESRRHDPFDILIAGCGTGRQALNAAARHPNARITAIDLSHASLAYAARKAEESGVAARIRFIHADILSMADWPETFHIIECCGVLHHMKDPLAGWQALNTRLRPGGFFKIALYSSAARTPVVAAQKMARDRDLTPTIDGIRAFRRIVLDELPADHPVKKHLIPNNDFYTTSRVRDLIFHVQEHNMDLPTISAMTETMNLESMRFTVASARTAVDYDRMFPDDPARARFENWHKFESIYPDTFRSMYQFWCRKPGGDLMS